MFDGLSSRDRGEGCATGQPQGVGPEVYSKSTSRGPTPEDGRKDALIIHARCAPLSPASGFPVSRSQQSIRKTSGLSVQYFFCTASVFVPFFNLPFLKLKFCHLPRSALISLQPIHQILLLPNFHPLPYPNNSQ
jgi:hypothetical protein